jgi:hypothetical protein
LKFKKMNGRIKSSSTVALGRGSAINPWTLAKLGAARHIQMDQRLLSDRCVSPPRPRVVEPDDLSTPFKTACKGIHTPKMREGLPTVVRYYTHPVFHEGALGRVFLPDEGTWRDICLLGPFVFDADRATDHLVTRNFN